jgi:hypothetical protein
MLSLLKCGLQGFDLCSLSLNLLVEFLGSDSGGVSSISSCFGFMFVLLLLESKLCVIYLLSN